MNLLLVAMLFFTGPQDADTHALLRLEDDWARALVKRDTVVFERLLAAGFVYTEDDKTMDRATVLHEVGSGSDTVTAAHNELLIERRLTIVALEYERESRFCRPRRHHRRRRGAPSAGGPRDCRNQETESRFHALHSFASCGCAHDGRQLSKAYAHFLRRTVGSLSAWRAAAVRPRPA